MAEASFRHGDPVMCDYTPSADVSAGDVIVVGDVPVIAHTDIPKDTLGAVAVGGGVYQCIADGAISAGTKVYWDDTANKVTATATGNAHIGFVAPGSASSADGDPILVVHRPDAVTGV